MAVLAFHAAQLPKSSAWQIPQRPPNATILASDGTFLGNAGQTGGGFVPISAMPTYLPNAVVAIEDRRFASHFGIDPYGLARAMMVNLMQGRIRQGGSTITQQLAKNLFLKPERTIGRKVKELILAFWLESKFSKQDILEMYLNRVYLGAGTHGVEAASLRYFGVSARKINLAQAAMLAGLLKAPSRYAPHRHPERALARARLVRQKMLTHGLISPAEHKASGKINIVIIDQVAKGSSTYIADYTLERLMHLLPDLKGDVIVQTTIRPAIQKSAELHLIGTLIDKKKTHKVQQGALIAYDTAGAMLAMVGGKSYLSSQFNRAVQARRQPGSTIKPIVYAAALEHGFSPETEVEDAPIKLKDWRPTNNNRRYIGKTNLRTALARSSNVVAVRTLLDIGPNSVLEMAARLGIKTPLKSHPSTALGTTEVSLAEMTAAYGHFANGGFAFVPHIIKRVRDKEGNVLYEHASHSAKRIIKPVHVGMMNDMLMTALGMGTGRNAGLKDRQAAGKTGTTQLSRDAWFIGYTANIVAGIWLGNDDSTPMKNVSGANLPAGIWRQFMTEAHKGMSAYPLPYAFEARMLAGDLRKGLPLPRAGELHVDHHKLYTRPIHGLKSKRRGNFISRLFD